jgi:hypothetical protein
MRWCGAQRCESTVIQFHPRGPFEVRCRARGSQDTGNNDFLVLCDRCRTAIRKANEGWESFIR